MSYRCAAAGQSGRFGRVDLERLEALLDLEGPSLVGACGRVVGEDVLQGLRVVEIERPVAESPTAKNTNAVTENSPLVAPEPVPNSAEMAGTNTPKL